MFDGYLHNDPPSLSQELKGLHAMACLLARRLGFNRGAGRFHLEALMSTNVENLMLRGPALYGDEAPMTREEIEVFEMNTRADVASFADWVCSETFLAKPEHLPAIKDAPLRADSATNAELMAMLLHWQADVRHAGADELCRRYLKSQGVE